MSYPEYPEIVFDDDGNGNGYFVKLEDELFLDINETSCGATEFSLIFEAGIKIGLKIAAMRAAGPATTDALDNVPSPEDKEIEVKAVFAEEATSLLAEIGRTLKKSKNIGVEFNLKRTRWSEEAIKQAIIALKSKGWKAKRNTGSDERDPGGWDDLVVSR